MHNKVYGVTEDWAAGAAGDEATAAKALKLIRV